MVTTIPAISVVKIGGGLTAIPDALDRVCAAVTEVSQEHRLLVVPGGGPFADSVRDFQGQFAVSNDAAHWMALLAMDQFGYVLAEKIAGCVLLDEPGAVAAAVMPGRVGVLAPSRWMRSADVLPHSWDVTSDSIAAFVAGALEAARLILIKPTGTANAVDPYFRLALPSDLSYQLLAVDEIGQLGARLSESIVAGEPG
jgi:5-(aminomethyl)-3-furanmethanol phosphate kinase